MSSNVLTPLIQALLNDLRSKGEIRAGTKWKIVYPLIKDDERFQNMLGQPGSTPLDLFWDMIEDIERDVRLKRALVEDVLGVSLYLSSPPADTNNSHRSNGLLSTKVLPSKSLQMS